MITEPTEKQYLPSSKNLGFLANVFGISWIILHFMPRFCIFLDYTKSLTKIAAIILAKKATFLLNFLTRMTSSFGFLGNKNKVDYVQTLCYFFYIYLYFSTSIFYMERNIIQWLESFSTFRRICNMQEK